jgi:hypothetical protein
VKAAWGHHDGPLPNEYGTLSGEAQSANYVVKLQSSAFVLSPPGLGEDCYRTSEILLSGGIPVIADGFSANYLEMARLPHVRVANWSALTATRLREALKCFTDPKRVAAFDYGILLMPFWVKHVQQRSCLNEGKLSAMQRTYESAASAPPRADTGLEQVSDQASGMRCSLGDFDKYKYCESGGGQLLQLCIGGRGSGGGDSSFPGGDSCSPSALRRCAAPGSR